MPFPEIDPVLISIGPFAIRWYALAYLAGIILGWRYMMRLAANNVLWPKDKSPTDKDALDDFLLWATIGIILGGRLGYVLFYKAGFYLSNPADILAVWQGGMSFHGGLISVVLAILWFCRKKQIPLLQFADLTALVVPIGLFFGRIANFINAELWGRVTDAPWGVVFPGAGPDPRHPSQLYEAGLEGLLLFAILWFAAHRLKLTKTPGVITGLFFTGYGLARFLVEFAREPDAHLGFLFGPITMGMLLSLPMVAIGIGFIVYARRAQ